MQLKGKRALVTGGAVRIGRAITTALQAQGVDVVVHYRNSEQAALALSPFTVKADLSVPDDCSQLMERVKRQFGLVDLLINNASIFTKESLTNSSRRSVDEAFQVNLFAPMALIRSFAAQQHEGAVINLLDRRIRCHDTSCVPYSLSKKGLEELTKLSALEYAPKISVNAVAPGPILPPPKSGSSVLTDLAGNVPLKHCPSVESIAEAALFLLRAKSITGQVIYVDGGQHLLGNGV